MISISVCLPAMPPMLATIGISTASATTFSIVASNRPTTFAARNAVARLMPSQTARRRALGTHAGEHVLVLVEAGHAHDRVLGFLADDVDDVVDRDAAEQLAVAG